MAECQFWCNARRFTTSEEFLTAGEIKQIANASPNYPLCRDIGPNHWNHEYIGDGERVRVADQHFFTMIPATYRL